MRALEEVSRGGSVLDPKVVEALVAAKDRMVHSPLASLTDRERSVLEVLSERQGVVVSKQALLQRVWNDDSDEHAVEVTVGPGDGDVVHL